MSFSSEWGIVQDVSGVSHSSDFFHSCRLEELRVIHTHVSGVNNLAIIGLVLTGLGADLTREGNPVSDIHSVTAFTPNGVVGGILAGRTVNGLRDFHGRVVVEHTDNFCSVDFDSRQFFLSFLLAKEKITGEAAKVGRHLHRRVQKLT